MQKGYTYGDVRPVVMSLDVIEESRGFEGFVIPVQLLHPPVYDRVRKKMFQGRRKASRLRTYE